MQRETPTKAGEYDVSIALDLAPQESLGKILVAWARRTAPYAQLWTMEYSRLLAIFHRTAEGLGIQMLGMSLHGLRHGGASHDRASRSRTLAEAQQRGNWKTNESLRRCEKHARIGGQLQRLGETKIKQLERLADQLKGNCEQLFGRLL